MYEERAMLIAKGREKADKLQPPSTRGAPGQVLVYSCRWLNCDWQFETQDLLYDHVTTAHTSQIGIFYCILLLLICLLLMVYIFTNCLQLMVISNLCACGSRV